jgi:hypothetical protein
MSVQGEGEKEKREKKGRVKAKGWRRRWRYRKEEETHENGSDEIEQVLPTLNRFLDETPLLSAELVGEQELTDTENRGDGRADLVRDGGEEFGSSGGRKVSTKKKGVSRREEGRKRAVSRMNEEQRRRESRK